MGSRLITTYEFGFTQGTIGFGVDAIGLLGIKLDSWQGPRWFRLVPRPAATVARRMITPKLVVQ